MTKREQLENQGFKTYENNDIEVYWNPAICSHACFCVNGNGEVFNAGRRPWIDVNAAPADEIAGIIDRCPSGALRYELKVMISTPEYVFEESANRSAAYIDYKLVGECIYEVRDSGWAIIHTLVPTEYSGRGMAGKLVDKVVEEARTRGVRVIPVCSYAAKVMHGNEKYEDVLYV